MSVRIKIILPLVPSVCDPTWNEIEMVNHEYVHNKGREFTLVVDIERGFVTIYSF